VATGSDQPIGQAGARPVLERRTRAAVIGAATFLLALVAAAPSEAIVLRRPIAPRLTATRRAEKPPEPPRARDGRHREPAPITVSQDFKRRSLSSPTPWCRNGVLRAREARQTGPPRDERGCIRPVDSFPSHWGATHLSI
jgi:hypothetical protein